MGLYKNFFDYQESDRLKVKGWRKKSYANIDYNKAIATVLILAKQVSERGHGEELSVDNYVTI